ncbi:MAG: hypothetical protein ABWZ52_00910 [Acidimicrobiales bacterium]
MCVNCVSSTEVALAQAGLAAAVLRAPVHRLLASAGVVAPIDPVRRDVRTVAFLRSLDLDPVDVLGADVVAAADAWVPAPYERRRSALPIGSHSLLITQ